MLKTALIKSGAVISIEVDSQRPLLAHIIEHETDAMNSVVCAFTLVRNPLNVEDIVLGTDDVVSLLFITMDSFKLSTWKYVRELNCDYLDSFIFGLDLPSRRKAGFVGTSIVGGRIVEKFLKACLGQYPWDAWHDPNYLDKFLLSGSVRPEAIKYKKDFENFL